MLAADEEVFLFLLVVCVFAVVVVAIRQGSAERMQRLRVLDDALRDPKLDAASRQELIRALNAPLGIAGSWRAWLGENLTPRRVFTGAAWLTMIVGGLIATFGNRYEWQGGIAALAIGLAVLALPIVVRELEGRTTRR